MSDLKEIKNSPHRNRHLFYEKKSYQKLQILVSTTTSKRGGRLATGVKIQNMSDFFIFIPQTRVKWNCKKN